MLAAIGLGALALALSGTGGVLLLTSLRRRQTILRRRLRLVAAPLTGRAEAQAATPGDVVVVQAQKNRSSLGVWTEARYPLISAPKTFPKALGIGMLGGLTVVVVLWFLRFPFSWWTLLVLIVAGLAVAGYSFTWFQKRMTADFVAKFPDTVDQIVRLSGTGVPVLEAATAVAEHAPHPVKLVLDALCDQLAAGIDPDSATRTVSIRFRIPELTMFLAVIRLQRRAGGGISGAFSNLSHTLRERRQTGLKAKASTAQTSFTLLILAVLPMLLLAIQLYTAPKSVDILFNTDTGVQLLRWGFVLIFFGIYVARTIASKATR